MAAGINDKFTETTNGTRPVPTTLTATRAVAATSISCGALTGWPTATAVHFIIYTTDVNGNKVAGSQLDCKGIVSGTTIGSIVYKAGTDAGNSVGAIVEAAPTAAWADDVTEGIMVEHKQTGAHGAVTADSLVSAGAISGTTITGSSLVSTGDSQLRSVSLETIHNNIGRDFVQTGCVWTGDSVGVNRNASMTAGVAYLVGRRFVISAVTARTFTASKDTYVDIDSTGTPVYTEVNNNAASPVLAANSIRIGTVVTAAGSIAATTSIGQGGFANIAPVITSQIFKGFDSLGNIVYPKGPGSPVLTQNPYKFSASGSTTTLGASVTLMIGYTESFDTGANFDPTAGLFTAPVAGYYQFNACVIIGTSNGTTNVGRLFFRKNGAEVRTTVGWVTPAVTGVAGGSFSMLMQLKAGDTVGVSGLVSSGGASPSEGDFEGYLVSAS